MSGIVHTAESVERGYNNRAAVPDHQHWLALYPARSAETRDALLPKRNLRYGPGTNETLDLFLPEGSARGTLLFIHGGYWRAFGKEDFSFVAAPFVAQGYAVAVIDYDLCPSVSIATIVDQCRHAVVWLSRDGTMHGANADRIVLSGHSAGGHLTAMLFATDWKPLGVAVESIVGGVSLSGLHDLTPLVLSSYNADLRLDDAEAGRQSPIRRTPTLAAPLVLAVGGDETSEFIRQTQILWEAWPQSRPAASQGPISIPARHHFNVVVDLADGESELTQATLGLFR